MVESQKEMPIDHYAAQIVAMVRQTQVTIITGSPGLGKTTAVPRMILEDKIARREKLIVCTLPTRAAVLSAAQFVAGRLRQEVGKTVGYQVRNDEKNTKGVTKILYTTDGTMVQRTLVDPRLHFCDVVMVDEAHLRSHHSDMLLAYLKSLLAVRPELRVVVSSATMQVEVFQNYFPGARYIEITVPSYPVEITYRHPVNMRTAQLVTNEIKVMHAAGQSGTTLVFLPGVRDIKETEISLRRSRMSDLEILPLHGTLQQEDQQRVFVPSQVRHRVVLSTNLAETSVTLPGVTTVIDTGTAWEEEYYPSKGYRRVRLLPISQSSAKQSAGRAGRTGPGKCIRLYTEADYMSRPLHATPEFCIMDATAAVMRFMMYGVRSIETADLLTPFSAEQVQYAKVLLKRWGAMTDEDELTVLGLRMAQIPLAPQLARMVLLACEAGAGLEAVEVAALLSVRQANGRHGGVDLTMGGRHGQYYDARGDAFTLLAVKREYLKHRHDHTWCQAQGVSMHMLENAHTIREQVVRRLGGLGLIVSYGADLDFIHRTLVRVWGGVLCVQYRRRLYRHGNEMQISLDPNLGSVQHPPTMVVALELLRVGKFYALHPLAVPEDMYEEVVTIYGNPWDVVVHKEALTSVRVRGTLTVEHMGVTRMVRVDIDAARSSTRTLEMIRNRTALLETESFPIEWLPISPEAAAALRVQGITNLAEIPKMPHLLRQMNLGDGVLQEVESALIEMGQYPVKHVMTTAVPAKVTNNAVTQIEQEVVTSSVVEDDWLVESLKGRPIESLELSRALRMRLYACGVATVGDLLEMTHTELRAACERTELLIQEAYDVLSAYGWSLQTTVEKNATIRMGLEPLPVKELPRVTPSEAREILGSEDYERFMSFRSPERAVRLEARNALLVAHKGLRFKATRMTSGLIERSGDPAIEEQDASQEAVLGAMVSIVKFDPHSGYRYATYGLQWMRQAIMYMVRNQGVVRLPAHLHEKLGKFVRACRKLEAIYGASALTVDFLSRHLKMEPEEVLATQELLRERQFLSTDTTVVSGDGEDAETIDAYLKDLREDQEQALWRREEEENLRQLVKDTLDDLPISLRARRMFVARYGLDGSGGKTLEEVGEMFDLTRERVRQLVEPVLELLNTPEMWDRFKSVVPWMRKKPKVVLSPEQVESLSAPVEESVLRQALQLSRCTTDDEQIFRLYLGIGLSEPQTVSEIATQLGMDATAVKARKESVVERISSLSPELWDRLRYQRRKWLRELADVPDEEEQS